MITTTGQTLPCLPITKCPDWCQLPAGHGWDAYSPDTGLQYRGHAGPAFGSVSVGGDETSDGRLVLNYFFENCDDLSLDELRAFSRDLADAADWLEARA
ncbi:MAG TPA: hypothetical protein VNS81_06605 [Nocardioides sp.]|nr:hypothetical protein [Nocardioides sp.]